MEYAKLVGVTGLPGLFELINSKSDGAIVRSLDDKSTRFVSSRIHSFSHLESIEVYTTGENVNLVEIFKAMDEGGKLPDEKNPDAVKKYFEKVYPELDFERVYNSDLKKMIRWYSILKEHEIEIKLSEPQEEEEAEAEETSLTEEEETLQAMEELEKKETTPKKKAAKKSASKKTK